MTKMSSWFWGHVGATPRWGQIEAMLSVLSLCHMLGQERHAHVAQMHPPLLGHVGAMVSLRRVYVGTCLWGF